MKIPTYHSKSFAEALRGSDGYSNNYGAFFDYSTDPQPNDMVGLVGSAVNGPLCCWLNSRRSRTYPLIWAIHDGVLKLMERKRSSGWAIREGPQYPMPLWWPNIDHLLRATYGGVYITRSELRWVLSNYRPVRREV